MTTALERAHALLQMGTRASHHGLGHLDDQELLQLFADYRWAVGQLAHKAAPIELRSLLNAAVLKIHGLVYARQERSNATLGAALLRAGSACWLAAAAFFVPAALTLAVVLGDPVLAFALAPRELLLQIDAGHWGARGSTSADVGMTLFYWANNLRAAFLALGLGVLAGLPGLLVLALNGILLGAVAAVAIHQGIGDRLLAWILPHGVPEISALVLSGGLGVALGKSWREPGFRRRRDALALAGRELVPLALLAALLVVCAAPLEGFVAPLELPRWLDLGIALGWTLVLGGAFAYAIKRQRLARSSS